MQRNGNVEKVCGPIPFELRITEDYFKPATFEARHSLGMRVFGILADLYHPNITAPGCCLGSAFRPGTPVEELVRLAYHLVTYQLVTTDERDAMNRDAGRYFRAHPELPRTLSVAPLRRGGAGRAGRAGGSSAAGGLGSGVTATVRDIQEG